MSQITGRRTALSVILPTVILLGCARPEKGIRLESPGKNVVVFVQTDATGRMACIIRFEGRVVVRSPFGIAVEGKTLGEKAEFGDPLYSAVDETPATRGRHPSSRNHFTAMRIPVRDTGAGLSFFLEWRAYDNGAMVRTVVPGEGEREVTGESFA